MERGMVNEYSNGILKMPKGIGYGGKGKGKIKGAKKGKGHATHSGKRKKK